MSRFYIVFFLLFTIQATYAEIASENFCKVDQTYKLSIFSKSDAKFISKNCELSPENQYIESFLIIKNRLLAKIKKRSTFCLFFIHIKKSCSTIMST